MLVVAIELGPDLQSVHLEGAHIGPLAHYDPWNKDNDPHGESRSSSGALVYYGYGNIAMTVTTTPSATAPATR
jgi:hypothetical protein